MLDGTVFVGAFYNRTVFFLNQVSTANGANARHPKLFFFSRPHFFQNLHDFRNDIARLLDNHRVPDFKPPAFLSRCDCAR